MLNETIMKFGYPDTLLGDYQYWVVLLRPEQITAGSLVLASKTEAERVPDVPSAAFAELSKVTSDLEYSLKKTFNFDKINYVLYMMVDKYVHWHVIPRYGTTKEVCGVVFNDKGWPKLPIMSDVTPISPEHFKELGDLIRKNWPQK